MSNENWEEQNKIIKKTKFYIKDNKCNTRRNKKTPFLLSTNNKRHLNGLKSTQNSFILTANNSYFNNIIYNKNIFNNNNNIPNNQIQNTRNISIGKERVCGGNLSNYENNIDMNKMHLSRMRRLYENSSHHI